MQLKFLSILLLIAGLTVSYQGFAQQGDVMIYGSLNYQNHNKTGETFGANPIGAGYFFNNHVVAGINYAFNWEKNTNHDLIQRHHETGLFYSDSKMLGDHFVIIGQLDAHYVWGSTDLNTPAAYEYKGYLLRLYPLVGVILGHGWTLKAKFCELSYQQTKGNDAAKTKDKLLIAGINGSTIGLG
ncbi:MAG: hypothetical protein J7539_05475, partial [Niabella sp.]|nr:hypothetical protein [Niabella sp.]